jgi:EAL and modified HD-GYP domain-containing signal transduction protein
MYTEVGRPKGYLSPTLILACARGHLLESLAQHEYPEQTTRSDTAFTVGALSVMDQLFGGTMQDLLAQVSVDVPVRTALLDHSGPFGDDLKLAECLFPSSSEQTHELGPLLRDRGAAEINSMTQNAFEWAHTVTQAAQ